MIATAQRLVKLLPARDRRLWKFAGLLLILGFSFFVPEETRDVVRGALADAYIQVTSFVALTLIIFHVLERSAKTDPAHLMQRHAGWQVVIAAVMGALPGCGGAIIIITQYVLGRVGFGSMVAVLTATMGDAAFLLIARAPGDAAIVIGLCTLAGIASGYAVEALHGKDFLRKAVTDWADYRKKCGEVVDYGRIISSAWFAVLVPGVALGLGNAFQVDTDAWFGPVSALHPTQWIGFAGAVFCFYLWAAVPDKGYSMANLAAHPACRTRVKAYNRILLDTNFVTAYVIFAYLVFELTVHWTALDLQGLFSVAAPFTPALALLMGFIPGCGPQIIVTSLYLSGYIPLSAQLANAISNDGDALFPALAIVPRAAFLATLYTGVPALIVGYGWYFLVGT